MKTYIVPPQKFPKSAHLNLNRSLSRRYRLVPLLDVWFANEDNLVDFRYEHSVKEKDDAWHPSGHCTPSPSELYQAALSTEEKQFPSSLRKSFIVGHFWHQVLQFACAKMLLCKPDAIEKKHTVGWSYEYPKDNERWTQKPWHWATGSADIAPLKLDDWEGVVDFKTMGGMQFRQNLLPEWAAPKYEAQLAVYMDWHGLDRGLIVCINKDSPHEFKEYEYEPNPDLVEAIQHKWDYVGSCIAQGAPPNDNDDALYDLTEFYQGPINL